MRLEVKTTSDLNIRKTPNTSIAPVGVLKKGTTVNVIKEENGFYYLSDARGWISKKYVTLIKNLEDKQQATNTNTKAPANTKLETEVVNSSATSSGLDSAIIKMLYAKTKEAPDKLSASTRLFGAPHQFISQTDFRLSNTGYGLGRKYMQSIVTESPIVYFLPGRPNYLPDLNEKQRTALNPFLWSNQNDDNRSIVNKIMNNKDSRYFSFISDYSSYMRYVNLLCRMCAIYMGIGDMTAPFSTKQYKYYDWSNYRYESTYQQKDSGEKSLFNMSAVKDAIYEGMYGEYQYVQFMVEPNTSFSENTNNSTAQSKLEGMFDSAEGIIKELSFLTSAGAVKSVASMQDAFAGGMADISDSLLKNNKEGFFSRLLGMSSQVLSGSNIIFPQIWGDSAYNKSYNININLVSPYGDKESIYLNIMVPLMHLLALSLPRQTTSNSYTSPFLIRAFAKGWFSCEMGIIDSINIDKGGQGSWTTEGLPSEVTVQIGLKDLYSNLMLSPSSSPELFLQNGGLIDFLAVTCGVNVSRPQAATQLEALFAVLFGSLKDVPVNLSRDIMERLRNSVESLYKQGMI